MHVNKNSLRRKVHKFLSICRFELKVISMNTCFWFGILYCFCLIVLWTRKWFCNVGISTLSLWGKIKWCFNLLNFLSNMNLSTNYISLSSCLCILIYIYIYIYIWKNKKSSQEKIIDDNFAVDLVHFLITM